MTQREHKDIEALRKALLSWLHSQEAQPKDAATAMLAICGTLAGDVANNFVGLLEGIKYMEEMVRVSAIDRYFHRKGVDVDKL